MLSQQIIITDTSCLILLFNIQQLNLLQKLFNKVLITQQVADEYDDTLPEWIVIRNPKNLQKQKVLEKNLDKGEASSLALALEIQDCRLVIDDLDGRKMARQLGLNFTGTLGILTEAKENGFIDAVKPLLEKNQTH